MYVKSLFVVLSFCVAVNTHHLHFVKRSQLKVDQFLFQDGSNEFQEFSKR